VDRHVMVEETVQGAAVDAGRAAVGQVGHMVHFTGCGGLVAAARLGSASRTPWPPRWTPSRLSPGQLDIAPDHVPSQDPHAWFPRPRGRPGRASPRKTKKAHDFPARKPGEPSVTRRIEFHLLYPWQNLKARTLGPAPALVRTTTREDGRSVPAPDLAAESTEYQMLPAHRDLPAPGVAAERKSRHAKNRSFCCDAQVVSLAKLSPEFKRIALTYGHCPNGHRDAQFVKGTGPRAQFGWRDHIIATIAPVFGGIDKTEPLFGKIHTLHASNVTGYGRCFRTLAR